MNTKQRRSGSPINSGFSEIGCKRAPPPELERWLEAIEGFNRDWFIKFEDILHKASTGPMWMKDERIADVVATSLQKLDGDAYRLDAYSVMSNHVHTVFKPLLSERELEESIDAEGRPIFTSKHPSLSRIMQSLKGSSSRECNQILARTGHFWEHESFDHVVRDGKFFQTMKYVLNNPVKGGIGKGMATVAVELLPGRIVRQTLVCR